MQNFPGLSKGEERFCISSQKTQPVAGLQDGRWKNPTHSGQLRDAALSLHPHWHRDLIEMLEGMVQTRAHPFKGCSLLKDLSIPSVMGREEKPGLGKLSILPSLQTQCTSQNHLHQTTDMQRKAGKQT